LESPAVRRSPARNRSSRAQVRTRRECLSLRDPTDCLLDAYDCVARRAYEHFLARGPRPGGEVEDWLTAEHELLLNFPVNVHEAKGFVYALVSVPGATAARLSVGIESRWLVILARHATRGKSMLQTDAVASNSMCADLDRPAKSVCVLQLPASVDADRSIAVLADGLLGIRMPKLGSVA
jgi:HSP20 family molecular chaperone IbpA